MSYYEYLEREAREEEFLICRDARAKGHDADALRAAKYETIGRQRSGATVNNYDGPEASA